MVENFSEGEVNPTTGGTRLWDFFIRIEGGDRGGLN